MRDRRVQERLNHQRDEFIDSIPEHRVHDIASSHRDGKHCTAFQKPRHGSYNVCYFVSFEDGVKWVVRVPLAPRLAFGARAKLESEIATMQLVAEKTTIPLPKIVAYSLADGPDPLSLFLILEYVEGQKISYADLKTLSDEKQDRFYTSLADIYIQLRRLEFPSIGCLARVQDSVEVRKKVVSMDINDQELEGLRPSQIQAAYYDQDGILASANNYVAMLLKIADNAFVNSVGNVFEQGQGEKALCYHDMFRQYAEQWVDRQLDCGPFVLVHGDLEPFNLIVSKDLDVISVLDWEWSRVVPRQFFNPPLWLSSLDTTNLAYKVAYDSYLGKFNKLRAIVRNREREIFGNELLADEWAKAKSNSGFLVSNALENWTDMDWFAHRYINMTRYRGKPSLEERVKAFMEEDPARKSLVTKKLAEGVAYDAEVAQLYGAKEVKDADAKTDITAEAVSSGTSKLRSRIGDLFSRHLTAFFSSRIPNLATSPLTFWITTIAITGTSYLFRKRIAQFPFWSAA